MMLRRLSLCLLLVDVVVAAVHILDVCGDGRDGCLGLLTCPCPSGWRWQ